MGEKRALTAKSRQQIQTKKIPVGALKKEFLPARSITLVTPTETKALPKKEITHQAVGWKASGIAGLPAAWCPPSFVISSLCFLKGKAMRGLKSSVAEALKKMELPQGQRLLIRSSGQSETMEERGELFSDISSIRDVIKTIESLIAKLPLSHKNTVHWLVQPYLEAKQKGFLSNELRLKKESRDWVVESDPTPLNSSCLRVDLAVRKWREGERLTIKQLACDSELAISVVLKEVARWACRFESRILFEWVWDGSTLWVVQAQTELSKSGVSPKSLINNEIELIETPSLKLFRAAMELDYLKYKKLKNTQIYSRIGYQMPPFYILDDIATIKSILSRKITEDLKKDLSELIRRDLVLRTDGEDIPSSKREMLPRSENLTSLEEVTDWMFVKFAREIAENNLQDCKICLIAHHFIPSIVSAWARAVPRQRVVRVESIWGIPEGLYWYSHDTHEVDTREVELRNLPPDSAYKVYQKLRYKERFISPEINGKWAPVLTDPQWGWRDSIRKSKWLLEIATSTRKIAELEKKPVAVMWFIGNHTSATTHEVLPWYHDDSEIVNPRAAPRKKKKSLPDRTIKTLQDWNQIKSDIQSGKPLERVTVDPVDVNLIRNSQFARDLAELSKNKNFVIELSGGILSHVYHILKRYNAQVECVDLFGAEEDTLEFYKIVRDKIPDVIEGKGESTQAIKLEGEALMLALRKKLVEEAFEAYDAKSGTELMGELADVLEVIHALAKRLKIGFIDIEAERLKKHDQRGGFDKGVLLQKTTSPHSLSQEEHSSELEATALLEIPPVEVQVSSAADLPQRQVYKRVDERQIDGQSENMVTLELEINKDLDWKDTSEIQIPIKTKGNHRFSLIIHVKREGAVIRIVPTLRHRALEIQQYLPGIIDG